jgi:hypothetical protein
MDSRGKKLDDLLASLGYKPLNRTWAKLEIVLGLSAAGVGVLLSVWSASRPVVEWGLAVAGLLLWVLGSYLAMAGHRSHLYQSGNEQTGFLVDEIRRQKDKD